MKYTILPIVLVGLFFLTVPPVAAQTISIVVTPGQIIQGEPFMIQIQGDAITTDMKKILFDGMVVNVFTYKAIPTAFVGVPLSKKPGGYSLQAIMKNGQTIEKTITIGARQNIEKPLGIPAKLGGNTAASAKNLVSTLTKDNKSLANIKTVNHTLWSNIFTLPLLGTTTITDPYGYTRQTDGYLIAHLGTDFRAVTGTPVMAMNRGIVRKTQFYTTYGNTIVIDHGLGLFTFYMHLSKIKVVVGELVEQGQVIGLSGSTGYADGPHLHVSVRIQGVSIDPMKFMGLFK